MKPKINPAALLLFMLSALLVILVSGCGKKGPPLPPIKDMVKPPAELAGILEEDIATLTWSHPEKKESSPSFAGFEIDVATRDISPDACKGCPLRFKPLGSVDAGTFEYSVKIGPKFIYYYRVRAFTDDKLYSNSSNTVQLKLEP